jgi:hypothetical protein
LELWRFFLLLLLLLEGDGGGWEPGSVLMLCLRAGANCVDFLAVPLRIEMLARAAAVAAFAAAVAAAARVCSLL